MVLSGFATLSRGMKIVIVTSLALNFLILGLFASSWLRHGGRHHGHGGGIERSFKHFAHKNFSREKRDEIRKAWRADRDAVRPLFKDVQAARQEVGKVLQQEPFDKAQFEASIQRLMESRTAIHRQMSEKFSGLVEGLSAEDKKAFGEYLQKERGGKWGKKRKGW